MQPLAAPPSNPISIHALREEGDEAIVAEAIKSIKISIHALREEGDANKSSTSSPSRDFYPRPPRGGRQST